MGMAIYLDKVSTKSYIQRNEIIKILFHTTLLSKLNNLKNCCWKPNCGNKGVPKLQLLKMKWGSLVGY